MKILGEDKNGQEGTTLSLSPSLLYHVVSLFPKKRKRAKLHIHVPLT
jgi:hypothetical protein